ncbi:MAG: hypothetical protein NTW79_03160 [Candidatus Berkelbacteria bacterium]|nr:hypothetical protein [Candidatus Berkelbacteria bacterium]
MKYRQSLFWDTKPENIDKEKHKHYIIERVLEFGRDSEVRMIFREYDKKDISLVAKNSRSLSPMTQNFWMIYFKSIYGW